MAVPQGSHSRLAKGGDALAASEQGSLDVPGRGVEGRPVRRRRTERDLPPTWLSAEERRIMIVLDTDTLTFFLRNHSGVVERMKEATDEIAITIISRIETLQGRFATLLKAADGAELQRGQQRLEEAERALARIPKVLPIDARVAAEFDRL